MKIVLNARDMGTLLGHAMVPGGTAAIWDFLDGLQEELLLSNGAKIVNNRIDREWVLVGYSYNSFDVKEIVDLL